MSRLADALQARGLIAPDRLREAERIAEATYAPLQRVLVQRGFVAESQLLPVLAEQHGMDYVALEAGQVDQAAIRRLPAKLAAHYGVLPLRVDDGVLKLAVSDPLSDAAVEDIETNLGLRVDRVLACRADIEKLLQTFYGVGAATVERILSEAPDRGEGAAPETSVDLGREAEDASVVRLVNQLIEDAIRVRATDIHFERHRAGVTVRRRIDGILYDTPVPKRIGALYGAIVARVKLMAALDIVERRLPQDGRASVRIGQANYDLRISIVPAMHGEDVVIRILPTAMLFGLHELGFSDAQLAVLEGLIAAPHGILFVTGPTGSGKSTTLYACLSRLNQRERKIVTIEDPVEYELPGITQTQIRPGIGLTFARALRSMLRHDPDVMMVGEVRDRETAETAIQTAMTGHLVLSTLHTNDAAGGAARLIDMGIDPYLITSTVQVFIAQRLVRVVCQTCKRASADAEGRTVWRGEGCPNCNQSGYRGRVAICEFLPLTEGVCAQILARASGHEIRKCADALGLRTLRDDGWDKVAAGITTPEEVLRVTVG